MVQNPASLQPCASECAQEMRRSSKIKIVRMGRRPTKIKESQIKLKVTQTAVGQMERDAQLHSQTLIFYGCQFDDLRILCRIKIIEEVVNGIYLGPIDEYFIV
jgi:hypothetical protein